MSDKTDFAGSGGGDSGGDDRAPRPYVGEEISLLSPSPSRWKNDGAGNAPREECNGGHEAARCRQIREGWRALLGLGLVSALAFVVGRRVHATGPVAMRLSARESLLTSPGTKVDSWEFKVPLNAARLDGLSQNQVREFVNAVLVLASEDVSAVNVDVDVTDVVTAAAAGDLALESSRVMFYDTPGFDLHGRGRAGARYILRWRQSSDAADLTFKIRGSDEALLSGGRDVSYPEKDCGEIKLELELVGTGDGTSPGGVSHSYSLDSQIRSNAGEGCIPDAFPLNVEGWRKLFPGLVALKLDDDVPIVPVNGIVVEQLECPLGKMKFIGVDGGTIEADAKMTLWQNGGYPSNPFSRDLSADFCFEFQRKEGVEVPPDAYAACQKLLLRLQDDAYQPWLDHSGAKTKTESVHDPSIRDRAYVG